jgi:hypothetical protein
MALQSPPARLDPPWICTCSCGWIGRGITLEAVLAAVQAHEAEAIQGELHRHNGARLEPRRPGPAAPIPAAALGLPAQVEAAPSCSTEGVRVNEVCAERADGRGCQEATWILAATRGGSTVARKAKPHAKGSKELCAALKFIIATNLDIAEEQQAAGDMDGARDSIDTAEAAMEDHSKWRCGEKQAARMRKRIAILARGTRRGPRRPARSRR